MVFSPQKYIIYPMFFNHQNAHSNKQERTWMRRESVPQTIHLKNGGSL